MQEISKVNQWKVEKFWKYIENNPEISIIKLKLHSQQMRSLFDKDVHDYFETSTLGALNRLIKQYIEVDKERIDYFINNTEADDWQKGNGADDLYVVYQLFKIAWLKQDIAKNGIQAPVQIIKTVESYHCHPGSDKKYALTVLDHSDDIPCFYIHYPDMDPCPFFENLDYEVLKTPKDFSDMFIKASDDSFNFEWGNVDIFRESDKIGDKLDWKCMPHFNSFAYNVCEIARKREVRTHGKWAVTDNNYQFLSYHDSVHRTQMAKDRRLISKINLIDSHTFDLAGNLFDLCEDGDHSIWLPREVNQFPTSLIDSEWEYNEKTALKFKLEYMSKIKGIY